MMDFILTLSIVINESNIVLIVMNKYSKQIMLLKEKDIYIVKQ